MSTLKSIVKPLFLASMVALLNPITLLGQASGRGSPEGALQTFKKALEGSDWKTVAACLVHPREPKPLVPPTLVDAWLRAQSASAELESALRNLSSKTGALESPAEAQHPFSAYLTFPSDYTMQIITVEPTNNSDRVRARIKLQQRGRGEEETVMVIRIGSQWFVTPPASLARLFAGADNPTLAAQRTEGLNKLADILADTAKRIRDGELRDRLSAIEFLLRGFHRERLAELLR